MNQIRLTHSASLDESDPSISSDGSKIVFQSLRTETVEISPGFPMTNYYDDIYVMNADGTNQIPLTTSGFNFEPSFSPDGNKIVYDSGGAVFVMNADGSNKTLLTNSANSLKPVFSPDGSKISFASSADGNFEIYVMNSDGSNLTRLTFFSPAPDLSPTFSPDGSKIAFESDRDGNGNIYVMNSDGTNQVRLTNNPATDFNAAFSPDGAKIVFSLLRDGNEEIYVTDADGTNPMRLTNNPAMDREPSWGKQADSDGDGIGDACENTAPTINAANAFSVAQNAALMSQPIATVFDNETPAANLTVSVVGAPPNGISVENIAVNSSGNVTAAVASSCSAVLGANTFTLQVSDGSLVSTANLTVNVTPSNPAVIALNPFAVLSPPNHKLQTFTVNQMVQSATDDCSGNVIGNVTIEKATSDEAVEVQGSGDTATDIIGADCRSIQLRSERSGEGNGRVYTITLKIVDSSGNTTRAAYKVFVPKGSQTAAEDAAYTVNGGCP